MSAFSKDITDLMRTCILSIFWPKTDIIDFFRDNNCTKNELKDVEQAQEELKRAQIVDKVFNKLNNRADKGLGQYRSMLKSLIEWDTFDPYFFEKLKKLNKEEALRNISQLKVLMEIRDHKEKQKIKDRRKVEQERYDKKKSLEQLNNQFMMLYQGKNEQGKTINTQERGYLFESFLRDLAIYDSIKVTDPFKITGEQIDGAIKFEGENYLLEAKWHDAFTSTEALYKFGYKVEGKFYGRGIFISVNGFSADSFKALIVGKSFTMILIDGADLSQITGGFITFSELLDKKISEAQTKGKIYIDVTTMKEKIPH